MAHYSKGCMVLLCHHGAALAAWCSFCCMAAAPAAWCSLQAVGRATGVCAHPWARERVNPCAAWPWYACMWHLNTIASVVHVGTGLPRRSAVASLRAAIASSNADAALPRPGVSVGTWWVSTCMLNALVPADHSLVPQHQLLAAGWRRSVCTAERRE